jgi:2-polyprenyl-3-methyl-5-hydroxy-6-metoxy-1,4-benzoquinol methylase
MKPYTKTAARYYDLLLKNEFKNAPKQVKFFKRIWGNKVKKILDTGCGTGRLSIPLAKAGYQVLGIDITPAMLEVAMSKYKAKNLKYKIADMRKFVSREKFDAVICGSNSIVHLLTKTDVLKYLGSCRKNLRKGGFLIFDVWDVESKKYPLRERKGKKIVNGIIFDYVNREWLDKKKKLHWWSYKSIITDKGKKLRLSFGGRLRYRTKEGWFRLLKKAGFKNIKQISDKFWIDRLYYVANKV